MRFEPLNQDRRLPVLASPSGDAADPRTLIDWVGRNRPAFEAHLHDAGVVLFRGFGVNETSLFNAVARAVEPSLLEYVGGDSPRYRLEDKVYTSTEYPVELEVLLHNELSYSNASPARVFFACLVAPESGGETHLADGREVYQCMPEPVRTEFAQNGVTYLQHLRHAETQGLGKSWQETFETADRSHAEARCAAGGAAFEWTSLGLRTATTCPAVRRHEVTGELCWHTQADQWHRDMVSAKLSVPGAEQTGRTGSEGAETLGSHVTYGDGSEIAVEDLHTVRRVLRNCEVVHPWQTGDLMVIDNVLAMHGRKPFTGDRKVVVAMG